MKTLAEKMDALAEKGKTAKLIKIANTSKHEEERCAAIWALRLLREETVIRCLLELIKEEDTVIRKAVANTLDRVATKMETDKVMHYADVEPDAEIAEILRGAAINSKGRTPRWLKA